jgi:hypothetical protein
MSEQTITVIPSNCLVYVAGPYTAKTPEGDEDHETTAERMRLFNLCMAKMIELGIKATSPLMNHMVRQYTKLPGDWKYWGAFSTVMLGKCSYMVVLMIDGWKESTGVQAEISIATESNIPIIYVDPKELLGEAVFEDSAKDGAILLKVSHVKSNFKRRLTIAGMFIPLMIGSTVLLLDAIVRSAWGSYGNVIRSARKHW